MPTRLALTGFMHGSQKFKRNEPVTFDTLTIERLERAGLVGKEDREDLAPTAVGVELGGEGGTFLLQGDEKVVDTSTTSKTTKPKKPAAKTKAGAKSSASPAAPVSLPPTLPPLQPGVPPPLPDVK